jgi:DHA1 family tetracycline resistance protein-like MFS transporter
MVGVQTVAPLAETKETGRAALAFIYATVLLDAMGFGIIIPVLPGLVVGFVGDTARGAIVYGIFGIVWALMQFTFSPLQGVLSDRFGRRPVLILSSLGLGLDYILMALSPNLSWLFLGRIISGITAASFSAASAYVADVTPPEKRASAFGFIGVMWGIGFILGPAMGGLLGTIGPRIPFWGAALLSLTSVGYGVLVLPESLRPELRSRFSWRRANPIGSVGLIRSRPGLPGLALVNFLNFLAFQVLPSIFVIYAGYRYGWDITAVGLALAIVGASTIVVQGLVVRPFIARFGETRALLTGLFFGIASFVAYGLAPNGTLFLAGVLLYAPLGLVNPALQGIMTRMVSPSEQGQLQGANASILGLTGIIGPGLFTVIFAFFIGTQAPFQLPGAPFILSAFLMVGALAIAARVTRRREEEIGKKLVTETVVP